MTDLLAVAKQAARAAGEIAQTHFGTRVVAEYKADKTPVTEVDRLAEAAAIAILKEATPDYGILAEESGETNLSDKPYWVIDPIDGTRNFSRGIPMFASGVALMDGDIIKVAAIYLPAADALYAAELGKGATCNGVSIHIADSVPLDKAIVATSASRTNRISGNYQRIAEQLMPVIGSPRILASSLAQGCYAADGKIDAYVGFHAKLWDVAPCLLIATEAGAVAHTFEGKPWDLNSETLVLGNPSVVTEITTILNQYI